MHDPENLSASVHRKRFLTPSLALKFLCTGELNPRVFVHISAVEKAGLSSLNEGQTVEYDEVPNKGKTSAENLKVQR